MKLKSIELTMRTVGYNLDAKPGIYCEVELATEAYRTIKVKLTDEQTKEVVKLAVTSAIAQLTVDLEEIDVVGHPGTDPKPRDVTEAMNAVDVLAGPKLADDYPL